jgi:hypothetical protein
MLRLGIEPRTFRSSVWRSPNWAIEAVRGMYNTTQYHELAALKQPTQYTEIQPRNNRIARTIHIQLSTYTTPFAFAGLQYTQHNTIYTASDSTEFTVWIRLAYKHIRTLSWLRLCTPYISMTVLRRTRYRWDWNLHVSTTQESTSQGHLSRTRFTIG